MIKVSAKIRNVIEKERDELLRSLRAGTYKIDSSELNNMTASLSWFKKNKKLLVKLDETARNSGLLKDE